MEIFQKPTESELEVLKVLWQMGRATVKQVNEEINKTKETGYTTTLKIMQIMFEKGLVSKNAEGKQAKPPGPAQHICLKRAFFCWGEQHRTQFVRSSF